MEFESFESFDQMMDAIDAARIQADKRVQPWQAAIKPGDYFVQATPYGFLIFGKVLEPEGEFHETEQGRNYRFCKCYSEACHDGEMGDVHVSAISLAITEEVFLRFKEREWIVQDGDELR